MDEKEFVQGLKKQFTFSLGKGIGDDASSVKINHEHQLVTTDLLVETIHFRLEDNTLKELAAKAVAVNLSDIAAMGGIPQYFYLNLAFPHTFTRWELDQFFNGLRDACRRWKVELAGGDLSRSPHLTIAITMVGKAKDPAFRNGAQPGDLIGITGPTGYSALGLHLLKNKVPAPFWTRKHKRVIPQIAEGQILAPLVSAMIDVSDGLLMDLARILDESEQGGIVFYEKLPVSSTFIKRCETNGLDASHLALAGGEDYVLLFTLPPLRLGKLKKENITTHIIGEVTANKDSLQIFRHGRLISPPPTLGYDHFNSLRND